MVDVCEVESKPIPAFYCCYLLRSRNRKAYYIGSTPNPARRLAQHNGASKGGAKHTSMQGKRPWEMTCIVTGFPSKFAALQFEWAWQNTHATRHIQRDVRDARVGELQKNKNAVSPSRRRRPPMSLEARLKNLHYLLGVKSFSRWPLNLRFFAADVYAQWERHIAKIPTRMRDSITIRLTPVELPKVSSDASSEMNTHFIPDAIRAIPVAYEDCKPYIEKSIDIINEERRRICSVCRQTADTRKTLVVICPVTTCQATSHLTCLSKAFLQAERNQDAFIPIEGHCPSCFSPIKWSDLMKELSLRIHGEEEIKTLLKPKRKKKTQPNPASVLPEIAETDNEDEDLDETWMQDLYDEN